MTWKKTVLIQLETTCEGTTSVQTATGDLYFKGALTYLRYQESDPAMGRTITTLKVEGDRIKVIRHGGIRSELTFCLLQKIPGFYETVQSKLELEALTHKMDIFMADGDSSVSWCYDLFVGGQFSGNYTLNLHIQKVN